MKREDEGVGLMAGGDGGGEGVGLTTTCAVPTSNGQAKGLNGRWSGWNVCGYSTTSVASKTFREGKKSNFLGLM